MNSPKRFGKLTIIASTFTIAFLMGQHSIIKAVNWDGISESIIWLSKASYSRGCVEISKKIDPNKSHWTQCEEMSKVQMKDTSDILNQEPQKINMPNLKKRSWWEKNWITLKEMLSP